MGPERQSRVEELLQAALELPEGQQNELLQQECAGDETLLREVESLLKFKKQADSFLETPALEGAAQVLANEGRTSKLSDSVHIHGLEGQTLSHYRVLSQLGSGGMGVVYVAEDLRLGRQVAIKVLPEKLSGDPVAFQRLQREARTACRLNHPNICTIHEVEEYEGQPVIVMELLVGQTLKERLRGARMAVPQILDIGVQIADALEAAHSAAIIHRDIKPANVFLTERGPIKVLDFGLAKLAPKQGSGAATGAEALEESLTALGVIPGTTPYMSPEQIKGESLDSRTDLFSFGIILYEMATGQQPFRRKNAVLTLDAILNSKPTAVLSLNSALPAALASIIAKTLEKDRSLRYQRAAEICSDLKNLKRPAEAGAAVLSTSRSAPNPSWLRAWFRSFRNTIDSVAVLPFENVSGDPNAEYLGEGIAESLISSLSRLPKLRVMAHSTVFRYKGQVLDARNVGRELDVRAVVTGRVVQRGDTLIIGTELVDVEKGWRLWGEQYNRKLGDILATQEEIATEISENLRLSLSGEEKKRLSKRHTQNPAAYQDYLKGRYYWNKRTPDGLNKGIEYFNHAIEKDPGYAAAYAGLAYSYDVLPYYSVMSPKEAYPKAKAAARKALEIDANLTEAHNSLAWALWNYDWDWTGSEREHKRCLELNPNYATGHHWYGWFLLAMGRNEEAVLEAKRALEIDSLSLIINALLGYAYYFGRRYSLGIEQLRKTIELDPHFPLAHLNLGQCYEQVGRFQDAITEFQKASELSQDPRASACLIHAYGRSGRRLDAQRELGNLLDAAKTKFVSPYFLANAYAGLGDKDRAFEWLETAYRERVEWMTFLKVDPEMDPLRSDPRFADLLCRIGFAP